MTGEQFDFIHLGLWLALLIAAGVTVKQAKGAFVAVAALALIASGVGAAAVLAMLPG